MNTKGILGTCLLNFFIFSHASATSINVDFGTHHLNTPDTYGGVGQAGTWNFILQPGMSSNLVDINNNFTGVFLNLGAENPSGNACDTASNLHEPLLCDNFLTQSSSWSLTFTGLENSRYDVTLYAPSNSLVSTGNMYVNNIMVAEMTGSNTNSMINNVSYTTRLVDITDGSLLITGSTLNSDFTFSGLSGIQIATSEVPIPASLWLFGSGLISLISLRIKGVGDK